jgi:hypothetical protein
MRIVRGLSEARIVRLCSAKWRVTERAVRFYVQRVDAAYLAPIEDAATRRARFRELLADGYSRSIKSKNPMAQARFAELLGRCDGMFVDKVEHMGTVNTVNVHITPADVAKALDGLPEQDIAAFERVVKLLPVGAKPKQVPLEDPEDDGGDG